MTSTDSQSLSTDPAVKREPGGAQTLLRGLTVIEAVASGCGDLRSIGLHVGTTRSTTHRLVTCLVKERYLRQMPDKGYALGPRLIELGFQAHHDLGLPEVARPHLEALAEATSDTVHMAVRDGTDALYLLKISGKRGLEMRSRIGGRMPLATTGIGKALILEQSEDEWKKLYALVAHKQFHDDLANTSVARELADWPTWQDRIRRYAVADCAFDLEENEPTIHCVATPVRDASGAIVAAISISSTTGYLPLKRMQELVPVIQRTGREIARELGWVADRRAG
jgi:DNA-binding IclR family transcriptional regulator